MDMAKVGGPLLVVKVLCKNRASVSGWSPIGCEAFLHKFEHPKSTPYYFSFLPILSVTHIICVCVCESVRS